MRKFFNTAGLCFPEKHYMVDPVIRLKNVEELIAKELYFTLHAPRQTGKTTYLHALARKLNAEGKYIAATASCERAGVGSMSLEKANQVIIDSVYNAAKQQLPETYHPENPGGKVYLDVKGYLTKWAESQEKPIVLLLDEVDALLDEIFVSVLRQIRDGYQSRPGHFPNSIILVGLRDVRDYKAKIRSEIKSWGSGSPFNIKSDSLFLKNFSKEEVFTLLEQHTQEAGQVFPDEVKAEVFRLTGGQPWLVNALARQMVSKILREDYALPITLELLSRAKRELILRRDTHLDSLVDKLREERVKRIVQAVVNGDNIAFDILDDDIAYARDLGIIGQSSPLKFANPIYAEIVPRVMASTIQEFIPEEIQQPWFINENNELEMRKVLTAFQEFYSENAESWLERFAFKESAHHLLLMAFLQRLVNAGGEIVREMAVGNGRIDLLVKFHKQRTAMELKINRGKKSIEKAKKQLDRYLDRLGLNEGYLILFDPGKGDWEKKLFMEEITYNQKKITMVGC
ncbi:MAG: AAA-like domain-containing protein [Candidatus Aminicenantes bacterium]|nr:AAA-like domain-containing protein [Candidatus Aminicenantes bacterium]